MARIRPVNQKEIDNDGKSCLKVTNKTYLEVHHEDNVNPFTFDRVFDESSTQISVFQDTAVPLVNDVLEGYNATIFAYGQTGTGKTFTMEGDITSEDFKGIIPRSVEALFKGVELAEEHIEFTFKVSFIEIYMEKIRDLLDGNHLKNNLLIREDKVNGIYIAGVTEVYVTSHEELLNIMGTGSLNRATAATGMNEGSSRSHSVFTITVTQKDLTNQSSKSGKLVLVDLAGSEMVKKTNATGQQLEEAKTINKSLSALGQVIYALTDKTTTHVPYRDSKLTRILQDSLGGNSKTVLIVNVSPSSYNGSETLSTLRFGMRAKSIENKVTVNQTRSVEELEALLIRAEKAIDAQTAHIMALSEQLQAYTGVPVVGLDGSSTGSTTQPVSTSVLATLQSTIEGLTVELDEEKLENSRKDLEINELKTLLKDKERLLTEAITEASDLLLEALNHYENQRVSNSELVRVNSDQVSEINQLKLLMSDAVEKHKYEKMELEMSLESSKKMNIHLHDDVIDPSHESRPNRRFSAVDMSEIALALDDNATTSETVNKVKAELTTLLSKARTELVTLCQTYGIDDRSSTTDKLHEWVDELLHTRVQSIITPLEIKYLHFERVNTDLTKKVKDLEVQRSRLESDLVIKTEKTIQLQLDLDNIGNMDDQGIAEYFNERTANQNKSLQQRLEQLVAVHRQLLRKFAGLEVDNSEYKKKVQLRDERIKQLESNSRGTHSLT